MNASGLWASIEQNVSPPTSSIRGSSPAEQDVVLRVAVHILPLSEVDFPVMGEMQG